MNSPRLHPRAIRSLAGSFLVLSLSGCATDGVAPTPPTAASASGTVAAVPAEPRAGETFEISQLDQKPVPRFQARPVYPAALREKKVSGEAVVDFIVDADGNVRNAFALRHTHPDFGVAATECVKKWKFQPAMKGGRAVSTHMQVPIVFTLREDVPAAPAPPAKPAAPLSGETFDISKLDQMPVPRFQAKPTYPFELRREKISGEAVVDFIVDTNGDVQNAFALRNTHPAFGEAAVAAVAKWKFKPGRKAGRDVNTHMQVPIVFTLNEK